MTLGFAFDDGAAPHDGASGHSVMARSAVISSAKQAAALD